MENIVQRKNKNNPTYTNCAMGLLYYFQLGGFYIREDKKYGYQVFIDKKDKEWKEARKSYEEMILKQIKRITKLDELEEDFNE